MTFSDPGSVPGQRAGGAAGGDDQVGHRRVDRTEEDDTGAGGELDAGHPAGRAALRADAGGGEVQQLGVGGEEDEVLLTGGELDRADDRRRRRCRAMTSQSSRLPG